MTAIAILPTDYYVYLHKKATSHEVFYVGKGLKDRAWAKSGRSSLWLRTAQKYGYIVEIVQDGLQDWAAIELEAQLIALYGRKDLGYGPLVNMCDAQIGSPGFMHDGQTKNKIAEAVRLKWSDESYRQSVVSSVKAKSQTLETKHKLTAVAKHLWQCEEYRFKLSLAKKKYWKVQENKKAASEKMKGKNIGPRNKTFYIFENFDGSLFYGSIYDAAKSLNIPYASIYAVAHRRAKYAYDWFLAGAMVQKGQRTARNKKIYHVLSLKTGEEKYVMQRDMPQELGISDDCAYAFVKGKTVSAGGWVLKTTCPSLLAPAKQKKYAQWFEICETKVQA